MFFDMKLIIDTFVYSTQKYGGISRIFNEIVPRLLMLDPDLQLTYYKSRPVKGALPGEKESRLVDVSFVDQVIRPWRLWHKAFPVIKAGIARLALAGTQDKIWHSTYFTELPGWQGKTVASVYDMAYYRYPEHFMDARSQQVRQQMRDSITHADRVVCISAATQQDVLAFFPHTPSEKFRVVHLGRSENFRVLQDEDLPEDARIPYPFILFVGKRKHYKNFHALAEAYAAWACNCEVHLVVVGPEWTDDELHDYGCQEWFKHVHLMGRIDDLKLVQLYNQALALIWPSLNEGFGLPLLEAMSCRCPIAAVYLPVNLEVAGEIPFYFEEGSKDSLIATLDQIVESNWDDSRLDLGERHASSFSWDKSAQQMLNIYRELA